MCVCDMTATVAVVKSRDMHWALLAQKDHKDVNLASLRMLLIADGANPCTSLSVILPVDAVVCSFSLTCYLIICVVTDTAHY